MKLFKVIIFFFLIFLPEISFAEVSDKVPSITRLWFLGSIPGISGFFSARYRIWAGIIIGLISFLFCISHYGVISDPFVGPDIRNEQGNPYVFSVYGSIALMLIPLIAGFLLKHFKNKSTT